MNCERPAYACCTTSRSAAPRTPCVNFAHPKDCGGVLVELVEPGDGH